LKEDVNVKEDRNHTEDHKLIRIVENAHRARRHVNFSMAHPKKPVQPRHLMPSVWAKNPVIERKKRRPRQMIAAEIRSTMQNWLKPEFRIET
jgi:hypothetical protein